MSHRKLAATLVAAATLLPLAAAPAASAAKQDLKVELRNVYLGADLIPLATATSQEQFQANAAQRFQTVLNNDFAKRAKALAAEIRATKPDLIALQEAAVWRRGPEGLKDGSATPANDVVYDSTALLRRELAAIGLTYGVVRARDWFDFEAPTGAPFNFDVRLTQRDVILRRNTSKVKVTKTFAGGFKNIFEVPTQAGLASQKRGWVGLDGTLGGRSSASSPRTSRLQPGTAAKQMGELLSGPAASKKRNTRRS